MAVYTFRIVNAHKDLELFRPTCLQGNSQFYLAAIKRVAPIFAASVVRNRTPASQKWTQRIRDRDSRRENRKGWALRNRAGRHSTCGGAHRRRGSLRRRAVHCPLGFRHRRRDRNRRRVCRTIHEKPSRCSGGHSFCRIRHRSADSQRAGAYSTADAQSSFHNSLASSFRSRTLRARNYSAEGCSDVPDCCVAAPAGAHRYCSAA